MIPAFGCGGGTNTIIKLEGDSSVRSDSFEISDNTTKLRYSVREENGGGGEDSLEFNVFVLSEKATKILDPVVTEHEPRSKTITLNKEPGRYVIDVRSVDAEWDISVMEER